MVEAAAFFWGGEVLWKHNLLRDAIRDADSGEKQTSVMHRCVEVRPVFPVT